jgi:hypothetical protein
MGSAGEEINNILTFDTTDDGLTIFDHIENHQCELSTSDPVTIQHVPLDKFKFPVDKGVSIFTKKLSINHTMAVYVRDHAGMMIEEFTNGDGRTLPYGEHIIEFSAPIKLYIVVESECSIKVTSEKTELEFGNPKEVYLGARSHHEHPSTSIRTTDNPSDLIQAVSHFGSALKTKSCERSYPTLRGHPPNLVRDDKLVIPSILEGSNSGVTIEVPEDYRSIFVIAPLAYYLDANLVPGEVSKIKTQEGFVHNLENTSRGFEDEVRRVLQQCFFFDCITRTEGFYKIRLHEREKIDSRLNIDFSSLYDKKISEQIESYLSIPYKTISGLIPKWKRVAHVEMDAKNMEMLPYLIDDLSVIYSDKRTVTAQEVSDLEYSKTDDFSRGENSFKRTDHQSSNPGGDSYLDRDRDLPRQYVKMPESEALENTWVGSGISIGASKAILTAFKNRLDQYPTDGNIDITVVINDKQMSQEGTIVDDIYSSRDQLSLTTELHHQLTTEELREVLRQDHDFLHYIGHIDERGFRCTDGQLDATDLDSVSTRTFLLNACKSYQQAIGLIESGAVAGIATTDPVLNSGAERIGKAVARLLNLGYPLISALKMAKSESIMGENYIVIGDGSVNLTQATSGIPSLCDVQSNGDGFHTIYKTFLTKRKGLGSITIPYAKNNDKYFLTSGITGEFKMDRNELLRFISMGEMPITIDSSIYWGDENEFIKQLG